MEPSERRLLDASVPLDRLVNLAKRLGSQNMDFCPTSNHICWRHRDLKPYTYSAEECVECFLRWFVNGD